MATGLDNIVDSIINESREISDKIFSEAESKAKSMVEEARFCARILRDKNKFEASKVQEKMGQRTWSLANMRVRDGILKIKQNIVKEIVASAKKFISSLPDEEYFSLVFKLCEKHFHAGKNCRMVFSRKDFSRLTDDIKNSFLGVAQNRGVNLKIVSSRVGRTFSGAILKYDEFEENCTLDAVFEEHISKINKYLMEILFIGEEQILQEVFGQSEVKGDDVTS